jgi:predicted RNA binding protein YcfA (HicA-like mRNA interferase family)
LSSPPKLPILSWREVLKVLSKAGFQPVRESGSHIVVESADGKSLTVPRHDEIRRGTLVAIIEEAGLTKEEFLRLLG